MDADRDMDMDTCKTGKGMEIAELDPPPSSGAFVKCEEEKCNPDMRSLLPPDHPLLQRFQQSLKEHLMRIKDQLTDEITDIKHKIKLKEEEREEFGVKLYDMQIAIEKQNEVLEEYSKNIDEAVAKRMEGEQMRESLRNEYDNKSAITKEHKFQYNQRVVELDHLQNLENNIRKWTEEFELELLSSKRVVSKDIQIQKSMAEEQHKMDLMSFNLQVEVKKREEELDGLKQQFSDQKEINDVLHGSLADANSDLEALQQEHKRLTQSWGEVIVAISHRDKVLFQAKESLHKQQEALKLTYADIEGTKKQTAKETEQNAKLDAFRTRLMTDLLTLKRDTEKHSKILNKLEMKMEELPKILTQTEEDYQEAKKEGNHLIAQMNTLQFKLEKQYAIKGKIEESILKIAQDQLMCDKASQYRLKVLTLNQQSRRGMEENLQKIEKQLANMIMKLEHQKNTILRLHEEGDNLGAKLKELNDKADDITNETKNIETQMGIKMKIIDKLSKVLDDLSKELQGLEISPTEYKIKTVEKSIQETDQKVREHQQFWLILQGHIVHLSQKRNSQLNDIQLARKQLMIISQKTLKVDTEIENADNAARDIEREIQNFSTKLELASAKVCERRQQHETSEFNCEMEHFELLNKLKDNEMRVLQLEQETFDLHSQIQCHNELVLDYHRETLSWETKYKLLDDTLRWRRKETAIESEIGNMRAEIHRMQIRYKELRRAQEKLIQDLDHCVMHRERIFEVASTKQKMEGAHFRSRTNIQQRINEVKTKLKQVHCEINVSEKKLNELSKNYLDIDEKNTSLHKSIDEESYQCKLLSNEIEQALLLKHQNLDNIVRKQTRAKDYRRLTASATPPKKSKSEVSLELNMQKQAEMNHHLIEVSELLLNEFPEKKFALTRLLQALRD